MSKIQRLATLFAREMGVKYTAALREVTSTPTAIATDEDGLVVIWQPQRLQASGKPAHIAGPASLIDDLVTSLRAAKSAPDVLCNDDPIALATVLRDRPDVLVALRREDASPLDPALFTYPDAQARERQMRRDELAEKIRARFEVPEFSPVIGDARGARLGMREGTFDPVFFDPDAAISADGSPLTLVTGQTGSGKTMLEVVLVNQWIAERPQIVCDLMTGRLGGLEVMVEQMGGSLLDLGALDNPDGPLDPLRYNASEHVTSLVVELLADTLGFEPVSVHRHYLSIGLNYGAKEGCILGALHHAVDAGVIPSDALAPVENLAVSDLGRLWIGAQPGAETPLRHENTVTVTFGNMEVDIPQPGRTRDVSFAERQGRSLAGALVLSSALALHGRNGVLHVDDAWVIVDSAMPVVKYLQATSRSACLMPILYTQRVSPIPEYIVPGQMLVLASEDPYEAHRSAELLVGNEPSDDLMRRIRAKSIVRVGDDYEPNYDSLRSLWVLSRRAEHPRLIRGAVAIYRDAQGRVGPVVIDVPEHLMWPRR